MSVLNIEYFVEEINRMRNEEMAFQKDLDKNDPQWFYIEGRINSLTNVLCFYYKTVGD